MSGLDDCNILDNIIETQSTDTNRTNKVWQLVINRINNKRYEVLQAKDVSQRITTYLLDTDTGIEYPLDAWNMKYPMGYNIKLKIHLSEEYLKEYGNYATNNDMMQCIQNMKCIPPISE